MSTQDLCFLFDIANFYALYFEYCEMLSILNIHILYFIALYIHGSNETAIHNNNAGKDQFPT